MRFTDHILQKENGQQYSQYVLPSLLRLTFKLLRTIIRNFIIISFLCHNYHISKSTCELCQSDTKDSKRYKTINGTSFYLCDAFFFEKSNCNDVL